MPTIIQAFEGTLLADAAYVDFPNVVLSGAQLIAAVPPIYSSGLILLSFFQHAG